MVWDYSHKYRLYQNRSIVPWYLYLKVLVKVSLCQIFSKSCYLRCWFFIFVYTGALISLSLLFHFAPVTGESETTHDGILSLNWKQSRLYLQVFCSLIRRDQGLIMRKLFFFRFMAFKLYLIDKKSVWLFDRLP